MKHCRWRYEALSREAFALQTGSALHSKKPNGEALGFFVAHRTGFEPATYRIGICCSIQLSYRSLAAFAAKIWS